MRSLNETQNMSRICRSNTQAIESKCSRYYHGYNIKWLTWQVEISSKYTSKYATNGKLHMYSVINGYYAYYSKQMCVEQVIKFVY